MVSIIRKQNVAKTKDHGTFLPVTSPVFTMAQEFDPAEMQQLELDDVEAVELSDRALDTDPFQVLLESADPQRLRFCLIEWLAQSPNRKVKSERKKKIAETLDVTSRQVERLLNQYWEDKLLETGPSKRSDKGTHQRLGDYWPDYIRDVYEKSIKDKTPMKPADVVKEVQRHAVIDLHHEEIGRAHV